MLMAGDTATLAGVNLYLTGRRDHVRWSREALIDALAGFLDASYVSKDAVKTAIKLIELGKSDVDAIALLRKQAIDAKGTMNSYLTRLSLIAPPEIVEAARDIVGGTSRYLGLLDMSDELTPAIDEEHRVRLHSLRDIYVMAAKEALALPRSCMRIRCSEGISDGGAAAGPTGR